MFVVLTQDVPKLGSKNALVNVARGYFVNYLEPKGYARMATPAMIERLKDAIIAEREASEKKQQSETALQSVLKGAQLTIVSKASEKGTLFQSLSEADITAAVKEQIGVDLDPSQLDMKPIKKAGDHTVTVVLADEKLSLSVTVQPVHDEDQSSKADKSSL